jgi:ZIP family zinc transporter/zinc and cadmium transporter
MFINVVVFSFLAGLSTIVGVYLVRHFEEWTKRNAIFLISFAIGVLLANAFFYLLPEAVNLAPSWFYWTLGAIIFFYIIEHFIIIHSCREEKCEVHTLGITSLLGIAFHSLIDGVIIGVSFGVSFTLGILVALAVIFHETVEGIFTYTLLIHDKIISPKALFCSWIVALATPLGAIGMFLFLPKIPPSFIGYLLAIAAGTFIYISASDLAPETHRKNASFLNICLVLLGIAFVAALERFVG